MKKYIFKLKWVITIKILAAAISIIGLAAMPYITKLMFDYDFSKGARGVVLYIGLYFLAVLVGMFFEYISQLHAWKLNKECNLLLKEDIFTSIVHLPYLKYKKKNVGEYISIFNNDIKVTEEYVESVVAIIQTSIQVIVYAVYIFFLDYRIAIVIMIGSVIALFLPNVTSKTLSARRGIHLEAVALYSEKIKDLLEGFKNINNQTRNKIISNQNKSLNEMENKMLHYGRFSTFANVFNGSFMYLLNIACFAAVGVLLLQSKISVGTGIATLGYVESFVFPLSYILKETNNIKSSKSTKDKLLGFLDQLKEVQSDNRIEVLECNNNIEFRNINVNFNDFSLTDFNYIFEKGKKYAIIGHNGSGKSTILNALMQYVDVGEGEIFIDGTSINNRINSSTISYTHPASHVYSSNFFDNVTIFGTYSPQNVNSVINQLENDKIKAIQNTSDCTSLSSGEKQLMEIVKIVLMNRDIVLLDEPFSALDVKNTKQLQNKLNELKNKIVILVTHDISKDNLLNYDEIILMENGKILKSGNPDFILQDKAFLNFEDVSNLADNCT